MRPSFPPPFSPASAQAQLDQIERALPADSSLDSIVPQTDSKILGGEGNQPHGRYRM